MATSKKVVKVENTGNSTATAVKEPAQASKSTTEGGFKITAESKKRAKNLRIFAILAWVVALGMEALAIFVLRTQPAALPFGMGWMTALIILIVIDLAFAVTGSLIWKKSNRLDPASEKEKTRFFIQNQLGAIISVIAFLPLVILILTDKKITGAQKGILAVVAVVALLVAGVLGVDYNPPSIEEYAEQTAEVEMLTGVDSVYWTQHGTRYHIYDDCQHINTDATEQIFEGTVAQARELKNITELCKTCRNRAEKDPQFADIVQDDAA